MDTAGGHKALEYNPNADPENGELMTILYNPDPPVDRFIEIRDIQGSNKLITTIEILSPSNKTIEGAQNFRKKQADLRRAGVSLVEIDLIRNGRHALFPPQGMIRSSAEQNYQVCVTAAWWHRKSMLHRIRLQHRLPRILVPLRLSDEWLALDLQELHDTVYYRGNYARKINYTKDPVPSLSKADAPWTDALLRDKGLRA